MTGLHVPQLDADVETLTAALAYAAAGFYVLPVKRGQKHPGSVVGAGWPTQSSRDPEVIIAMWAGTDHGIALHAGRSGAVVLDVDKPSALPEVLRTAFAVTQPPMQSTRRDEPGRGHYLFAQPTGRIVGNGAGTLGREWGDVRGRNGVIVVAPSTHPKASISGWYHWDRTGPVPPLPAELAAALPDSATTATDAATDADVTRFITTHTASTRPALMTAVLGRLEAQIAAGGSRHNATVEATCWAMREAAAGLYPAAEIAARIRAQFVTSLRGERPATSEWSGILAFAVAQAARTDSEQLRVDVETRAPRENLRGIVAPDVSSRPATSTTTDPSTDRSPAAPDDAELEREAREALYSARVADEAMKLRIRDDARALHEQHKALNDPAQPFDDGLLAEILARPAEPPYRVEGLIPACAGTLLVAQRKIGKTTWLLNLIRSLITGDLFLGRFPVRPITGRVAILNFEVSAATVASWAADIDIPTDRLYVVNLRGRRNPLTHPADRAELATRLRAHQVETLIVDPFGRAYTGKSQNDAGEVSAWLIDLDTFTRTEAGITDLVLAAHAGWDGERTRGASALEDWADSIITLTKGKDDDDSRYMRAIGRDVDIDEDALTFDHVTRTLALAGTGSRRAKANGERTTELRTAILAVVHEIPGATGAIIERALRARDVTFQKGAERKVLRELVDGGMLTRRPGKQNAQHHYIAEPPQPPQPFPGTALGSHPNLPLYGEGGSLGTLQPEPPQGNKPRCTTCNQVISEIRNTAGFTTCAGCHKSPPTPEAQP